MFLEDANERVIRPPCATFIDECRRPDVGAFIIEGSDSVNVLGGEIDVSSIEHRCDDAMLSLGLMIFDGPYDTGERRNERLLDERAGQCRREHSIYDYPSLVGNTLRRRRFRIEGSIQYVRA